MGSPRGGRQIDSDERIVSPFSANVPMRQNDASRGRTLDPGAVAYMEMEGNEVWLTVGRRTAYSSDLGINWTYYDSTSGIGRGGTTGLTFTSRETWLATAYDTSISDMLVMKGGGLSLTTDHGSHWLHFPQPTDQAGDSILQYFQQSVPAVPITTFEQNVTYDISQVDSVVFVASWAGGLRTSIDHGRTWKRILLPSDPMMSLDSSNARQVGRLDPRQNNNHMAYSVISYKADDRIHVWCGTANGINMSQDGGVTWTKYNRSNSGICGNWTSTLFHQSRPGKDLIWASTWLADVNDQTGLCFTTNNGSAWNARLLGRTPYGISSRDDTIYVSTDAGLFRTLDGSQWKRFIPTGASMILDAEKDSLSRIWIGSADGLQIFQDSEALWQDLGGLGNPPKITSVSAPDTVIRPMSGSNVDTATIQVTDPDSADDVTAAWFVAHRPSGKFSSVSLQNLGNGRFETPFLLTPDAELGRHKWVFFARDKAGNVSDSVIHWVTVLTSTSISNPFPSIIVTLKLYQNYPNPFNPVTIIRFSLSEDSYVSMKVFNAIGQQVATLVEGRVESGNHEVQFDAKGLGSGVYFCRMQAGWVRETRRLLLVR